MNEQDHESKVDFEDEQELDKTMREAMKNALNKHRALGNPLPDWDGKQVKIIAPEDLPDTQRE
jgi:hypothetical protein